MQELLNAKADTNIKDSFGSTAGKNNLSASKNNLSAGKNNLFLKNKK